jgi:hypothetical protein
MRQQQQHTRGCAPWRLQCAPIRGRPWNGMCWLQQCGQPAPPNAGDSCSAMLPTPCWERMPAVLAVLEGAGKPLPMHAAACTAPLLTAISRGKVAAVYLAGSQASQQWSYHHGTCWRCLGGEVVALAWIAHQPGASTAMPGKVPEAASASANAAGTLPMWVALARDQVTAAAAAAAAGATAAAIPELNHVPCPGVGRFIDMPRARPGGRSSGAQPPLIAMRHGVPAPQQAP